MIQLHPNDGIQCIRQIEEGFYEVEFSIRDGWLCMHFEEGYMEGVYYVDEVLEN